MFDQFELGLGLVHGERTVLLVGHGGYVEDDVCFVCYMDYVVKESGSVKCLDSDDQDYGRFAGIAGFIYINATL